MSYTDDAAEKLAAAYGGPQSGVFGDLLGPLLELLVGLLTDCLAGGGTTESVVEAAKHPTLRTRLGLRLRARRAGLDPERTTRALLEVGSAADPTEVAGFVAENL